MSLKLIIAEDNIENVNTLQVLLSQLPIPIEVIGIATTLYDAKSLLLKEDADIALLDIQFKRGTIFEVLNTCITEKVSMPDLIFITAHGSFEYATKAIQYACLDFINKPIDQDILENAIKKYTERRAPLLNNHEQLSFLLDLVSNSLANPVRMAVPRLRGEIEFITIADILYIEADASTTIFNCLDQKFHSSKPFGYYSSLLLQHESFMQISRSCLLNKDLVKKYQPNDRIIRLLNGEELKVSHRYKTYVRNNIDSNQETLMNKAISGLKRLFD